MKSMNRIIHYALRPIHYFLKFFIILIGWKDSRHRKIIESTIYELRLMFVFSLIVIGLYIFIEVIDNSNDPELIKLILKLTSILITIILFLTFRIAIKLNFKYRYHLCDKQHESCHCKLTSGIKYIKENNMPQTHSFKDHKLKLDNPEHNSIKENGCKHE